MSNQRNSTDVCQGEPGLGHNTGIRQSEPELDWLDRPVIGARRFNEVLKLPGGTAQVNYLLSRGRLDAAKCGKLWVSTPRKLLRSLGIKI
jgi:hypothetical protein